MQFRTAALTAGILGLALVPTAMRIGEATHGNLRNCSWPATHKRHGGSKAPGIDLRGQLGRKLHRYACCIVTSSRSTWQVAPARNFSVIPIF